MYKIELFIWQNEGLKLLKFKKPNGREAMDFAYSQQWDLMKIYNEEDELVHQNTKSVSYEQYV